MLFGAHAVRVHATHTRTQVALTLSIASAPTRTGAAGTDAQHALASLLAGESVGPDGFLALPPPPLPESPGRPRSARTKKPKGRKGRGSAKPKPRLQLERSVRAPSDDESDAPSDGADGVAADARAGAQASPLGASIAAQLDAAEALVLQLREELGVSAPHAAHALLGASAPPPHAAQVHAPLGDTLGASVASAPALMTRIDLGRFVALQAEVRPRASAWAILPECMGGAACGAAAARHASLQHTALVPRSGQDNGSHRQRLQRWCSLGGDAEACECETG